MHVGAATHVGKVRVNNEDGYLVRGSLLAVADGMGGHNAGEVASQTALAVLRDYPFTVDIVSTSMNAVASATATDMEAAAESVAELVNDNIVPTAAGQLENAVRAAHEKLLAMADADPTLSGMGTTLTAALLQRDTIHVAHVGDSRLYLFRNETLWPVTDDHSVVAELLRAGQIDEEAARRHPLRNAVTRALGAGDVRELAVDVLSIPRRPGDGLLLCTDGLSALVSDGEISTVLQEHSDPQSAVDALIGLALDRGGVDNITVVVAWPKGRGVSR